MNYIYSMKLEDAGTLWLQSYRRLDWWEAQSKVRDYGSRTNPIPNLEAGFVETARVDTGMGVLVTYQERKFLYVKGKDRLVTTVSETAFDKVRDRLARGSKATGQFQDWKLVGVSEDGISVYAQPDRKVPSQLVLL